MQIEFVLPVPVGLQLASCDLPVLPFSPFYLFFFSQSPSKRCDNQITCFIVPIVIEHETQTPAANGKCRSVAMYGIGCSPGAEMSLPKDYKPFFVLFCHFEKHFLQRCVTGAMSRGGSGCKKGQWRKERTRQTTFAPDRVSFRLNRLRTGWFGTRSKQNININHGGREKCERRI